MHNDSNTTKQKFQNAIWVLPCSVSLGVGVVALLNWGEYWSVPMYVTAVLSLVVLGISVLRMYHLGIWGSMVILGLGGIVVATKHPEEVFSSEILIASIIAVSIMVANAILSCVVQSLGTSVQGSSPPQWEALIESLQMSENAKRVLFRDRELELLRKTVQEDISRGELHSALVICEQMATVFGAVEEAEQLRTKVQEIIHEHHETRLNEEVATLQILLDDHKWVYAYQYAAKLRRLFPDAPVLHGIEQQISDARTEYRHGLEDRFLAAAKRDDVEKAMVLLRELDKYLTPDEARNFRDTATAVITTYRESLGQRFKMAVSDHRWHEAIEFGEEITRQFPNTKMAKEVQDMYSTIRLRAQEDKAT